MQHTVNETLEYVISLTNHVRKGDVSAAILTLLVELGFQVHMDGVGYLRKAILLRCNDPDMRLSSIYQEIVRLYGFALSCNQVEQAMVGAIEVAWKNRDSAMWRYFFYGVMEETKPSNKAFVARIACFMELWRDCC